MTIVLTAGGVSLELPPDLLWADELSWSAVAQSKERGLWGTLIVDAMARNGGRPITLQGDGSSAWIDRGDIRNLRAWAAQPGLRLSLSIRGESFTVIFDHGEEEESRAISARPVVDYADAEDSDPYCDVVLRFIEASETV